MGASHDRHVPLQGTRGFGTASLVWRAIRWRAGSSLVFLAVGIAAVGAAAAGPIYLASADQSVLEVQLASQPVTSTGFTIASVPGGPVPSPGELTDLVRQIPGGSGLGRVYGPPVLTVDVPGSFPNPLAQTVDVADLIWRTGACGQLTIVAGTCPVTPDQVVMSTRSAAAIGARIGTRLAPLGRHKVAPLQISGLYTPPLVLSNYWWGSDPFAFGTTVGRSEALDAGFLTEAGAERLAGIFKSSNMAQVPLGGATLTAPGLPAFVGQLSSYSGFLAGMSLSGSTPLGTAIASIETQEQQMRSIIGVIVLELVLLALLVLFGVASTTSAERLPDMAIAELRGLTRRSIAVLALREPAMLLALATPAGLAVGWALVLLVAPHLFVAHAPVRIDSLAVAAAVATLVAGLCASALGARSLIRPSLVSESRASAARRTARAAGLVDAVAIALTVVGVVELATAKGSGGDLAGSGAAGGGGTAVNPLAALAPALVGVAAGIVGARLLPLAGRAVARSTRYSRHIAATLASRSIMRRPGLARRVLVPAIAVGLLVFSVASYQVANTNRATQALFATGAPVALGVDVAPGVDLVSAVRAADPGGREAMAVAEVATSSGNTLAVDSSRFAAVAAWPPGTSDISASAVASYLSPASAPPLLLRRAADIRLEIDLAGPVRPPPLFQMTVFDESAHTEDVIDVASLAGGTHFYVAPLLGACKLECRVDSFAVFPAAASTALSVVAPLVLEELETRPGQGRSWQRVEAGLSNGNDWTGSTPSVSVQPSPSGLRVVLRFATTDTPPTLERADAPGLLPAVVTSAVVASNASVATPDQYPAAGIGGQNLTVSSTVVADALPAIGDSGVLVDLSLAQAVQTSSTSETTFYVWCHTPPSDALVRRLRSEGVEVTSVHYASSAAGLLRKSGPALAFDLFVLAAAAAALLSVGAIVFAVASASRRRALEVAALAAAGVPRAALRRSLVAEYGTIVIVGTLLGLLSGIVTIRIALGSLPEFVPGRVGPPLGIFVPWLLVLAATGAVMLLLLTGVVLATALIMRRATPDSLRVSL